MNKLLNQLIRFVIVGGVATLIDFSLLIILTEVIKINYLISGCIAFIVSLFFNYILSINFVFNVTSTKNKTIDIYAFGIIAIAGLGINSLLLFICSEIFDIYYLYSKSISTIIVIMWNFLLRKLYFEKQMNIKVL